MSHTFSTVYVDSNLAYGDEIIPNKFKHFMIGLFQVNGTEHQIWSIISNVLFSALQYQGFGIPFSNYFMREVAQLVGFSYVEYCDMVQSDDDVESTHM